MRRVCGWCRKELGSKPGLESEGLITHGICSPCALKIATGTPRSARDMLNMVSEPVFLVGPDGVLHAANNSGCRMVGMDHGEVVDRLLGEVFECANAGLPGGCGHSIHCSMCVMRNTLIDTLDTGKGADRVPATRNVDSPEGEREVHFRFSTEKVDGKILIRIESTNESAKVES